MTGYLVSTAVLGAKIRDYTPKTEVGKFQGVRMVFVVLIPMVIGPFLGGAICRIGGEPYLNEFNHTVYPPNKWLFLVTAVMFVLAIIPVVLMIRKENKAKNEEDDTAKRIS
jgi:MFS family permease